MLKARHAFLLLHNKSRNITILSCHVFVFVHHSQTRTGLNLSSEHQLWNSPSTGGTGNDSVNYTIGLEPARHVVPKLFWPKHVTRCEHTEDIIKFFFKEVYHVWCHIHDMRWTSILIDVEEHAVLPEVLIIVSKYTISRVGHGMPPPMSYKKNAGRECHCLCLSQFNIYFNLCLIYSIFVCVLFKQS